MSYKFSELTFAETPLTQDFKGVLKSLSESFPAATFEPFSYEGAGAHITAPDSQVKLFIGTERVATVAMVMVGRFHFKKTYRFQIWGPYVDQGRVISGVNTFERGNAKEFVNAVIAGNWIRTANPLERFWLRRDAIKWEFKANIANSMDKLESIERMAKTHWIELVIGKPLPATDTELLMSAPQLLRQIDSALAEANRKLADAAEELGIELPSSAEFGNPALKYDRLRML